jgi:hypothetical protein
VKNISPWNKKPPTLLHVLVASSAAPSLRSDGGGVVLNHYLQSYILYYCLHKIWKTGGRRVLQLLAVELPHLPGTLRGLWVKRLGAGVLFVLVVAAKRQVTYSRRVHQEMR